MPGGLAQALEYAEQLRGAHYGWWTGGKIPAGPPAWAQDGPPPAAATVRDTSCFCAGIPNLMRRVVGLPIPCEGSRYCGGTGAYGMNFSTYPKFNLQAASSYPEGTLLGIKYKSVADQGHVAVLLKGMVVLQSFAQAGSGHGVASETPGVNEHYTLAECHAKFEFCRFEYHLPPERWLLGEA